jgi:hypothetical protein
MLTRLRAAGLTIVTLVGLAGLTGCGSYSAPNNPPAAQDSSGSDSMTPSQPTYMQR